MDHSVRSEAEVLFNFINHHGVNVLGSVIANLNEREKHQTIAKSIHMDAGQFSKFLDTCMTCTWTVKPSLSPIIDIFTEQQKQNAERAKGQSAHIHYLGERHTVDP